MISDYQIAQINLGRLVAPFGDPRIAGFVARLNEINTLAERSPGFVCRLGVGATGSDAAYVHVVGDPSVIINMSVWQSVEALHAYVYRSAHAELMRDRKQWFERYDGPSYALWWVERGYTPTVEEGLSRLQHLAAHGATQHAFWFGQAFPPPDAAAPLAGARPECV